MNGPYAGSEHDIEYPRLRQTHDIDTGGQVGQLNEYVQRREHYFYLLKRPFIFMFLAFYIYLFIYYVFISVSICTFIM